jgi:pimeloyl-ACP methyl ester carboxylesterase
MRKDPQPLERPVVLAAGLLDLGFDVSRIQSVLNDAGGDRDKVITVTFWALDTGSFDGCRDHLIDRVEDSFGSTGTDETVEVDVIGFSMGGLVARHAARPRSDGGKRLNVRRLFTISTPHQGARMAGVMFLDQRANDMRVGSEFLAELNADLADADYDVYPYVRLGDSIVGAENAAPPGHTPWWVAPPAFSFAHLDAAADPRIIADIIRRLRNEPTLAVDPPTPLLDQKSEIPGSQAPPGT